MNIASITFQYDQNMEVKGYTVYVDGKSGQVQSFSGQVNIGIDEMDLSFIKDKARAKIEESFAAEEK